MDDDEHTEIRRLSAYYKSVHVSDRINLRVGDLLCWGEAFEKLALGVRDSYDEMGSELEDESRLFEDEVDWDSLDGSLEQLTNRVVKVPFVTEPSVEFTNETNKALNAHIITATDKYSQGLTPTSNVLDLCCGDGEMLNRLGYRGLTFNGRYDGVGAVEFNPRAHLLYTTFTGYKRVTRAYLEDLPVDYFYHGGAPIKYDLIIIHQGPHHIMKTSQGSEALRRILDNHLSPQGMCIGTKIDVDGLNTISNYTTGMNSGVEGVRLTNNFLEGSAIVRVGNKYFEDPKLSDSRFVQSFPNHTVHLMQGRGAFRSRSVDGSLFTPPKSVAYASRKPEVKCVTYFEIVHRPFFHRVPDDLNHDWVAGSIPPKYVDLIHFNMNRGKHFGAADIPYLNKGSVLFSVKLDGHTARVIVGRKTAYLLDVESGKTYCARGLPREGPTLFLQCESMPDGSVYLTDPIHMGPGTPLGFMARLRHYESLSSGWLAQIIKPKVWRSDYDPSHYEGTEGVVVQGVSSPSPYYNAHYEGTARYSKFVPTIDIRLPDLDGIWEVSVDNPTVPIRPRPFKQVANSKVNIQEVENSIRPATLGYLFNVAYDRELESATLKKFGEDYKISHTEGFFQMLRFPNCRPLSRSDRKLKQYFLEAIGFTPPAFVMTFKRPEPTRELGWGLDLGTLAGNGLSKGDGPVNMRDLIALVQSQGTFEMLEHPREIYQKGVAFVLPHKIGYRINPPGETWNYGGMARRGTTEWRHGHVNVKGPDGVIMRRFISMTYKDSGVRYVIEV